MITSGELFENKAFDHIMFHGYKYEDINMRLEQEDEEEAELLEILKEKQKLKKIEMLEKLKKKRNENDQGKNDESH